MKDKVKVLSEDELLKILASNGLMVKRPILLCEDKVLVGFKEDEWKETLNVK
ncbi:MAG: transcriptional regulator, Spx/MgsR family protein [Bacteroidetes bacterium]|nr:transcriptional regulator, Spx/MgsR family protein [Bacteroidota bacterium]